MATIGLEGAAAKMGAPKVGRVEPSEATSRRFSAALEKAQSTQELNPQQVAPPQLEAAAKVLPSQPVSATDPAGAATTTDAQERARRALNLDPVHATQNAAPQGDAILHGLEKMRGFFSAQEARVNTFLSGVQGPLLDTNRLMALQMEIMNFSLVVTVASKLTGNSTQALESLLKG